MNCLCEASFSNLLCCFGCERDIRCVGLFLLAFGGVPVCATRRWVVLGGGGGVGCSLAAAERVAGRGPVVSLLCVVVV